MNGSLKTDEVIENKDKYFIVQYIRAFNIFYRTIYSEFISYRKQLTFFLCLLYGGFLYDINSCCENSKQTIITSI